ncbi:ribbon-helix-helix protein, CopG family, partial [bacterium]
MVERIGISLEQKLLAQFDKLIAEKGYSNRS